MSPGYILAIRKAKNIHFNKKKFGGFAHPFANVQWVPFVCNAIVKLVQVE